MNTLSQREEQIMLTIWTLHDDAYLVAIKKYLSIVLRKNWSVGAIHKPLRRLEKAGYLKSYLGEATAIRGGRAKKIYRITRQGLVVLAEHKKITQALWADFLEFNFSG